MKTFLVVLTSAVIGSILFWLAGRSFGNTIGSALAGVAFFLLLLAYGWRQRSLGPVETAVAALGSVVLLGGSAVAGAVTYDAYPLLGNLLMAAVSVGYYPPGADVPIIPGMGLWAASFVALTLAGLISGTLLPHILGAGAGEESSR
jgi:hypothetical protein